MAKNKRLFSPPFGDHCLLSELASLHGRGLHRVLQQVSIAPRRRRGSQVNLWEQLHWQGLIGIFVLDLDKVRIVDVLCLTSSILLYA